MGASGKVNGKRLRELRESRNLTLEALSDATGLGWRTIHRVEHDEGASLSTLVILADYFGVSIDELVTVEKKTPSPQIACSGTAGECCGEGKQFVRIRDIEEKLISWSPNLEKRIMNAIIQLLGIDYRIAV